MKWQPRTHSPLSRRCMNPNGESNRFRVPEISVPQVNDALLTRHSDGAPTEHRMTVTMAPGASSDCTKAYPIASDAPTTSPSHGNTSSVHGESPRPIPEKRNVLSHPPSPAPTLSVTQREPPRQHRAQTSSARSCVLESTSNRFVTAFCKSL